MNAVSAPSVLLLVALIQHNALAQQEPVTVTEVTHTVLVFATSSGNVVASVGPDGALLVGTPSLDSTAEISRILAGRTKSAMRYVVIAPHPLAESQGDAGWGQRGAFVAMQEKALARLGGHAMGAPPPLPRRLIELGVDRPRIAFSEVITFDMNGDGIHIVKQPPAYSNADALAHFHVAHLLYFGEVFPGDGFPDLNANLGGTLEGFVNTLEGWTGDTFRIVPARGKVVSGASLAEFCAMLKAVQARVRQLVESGNTEDQVVAVHPTADFNKQFGNGRISADSFVHGVYRDVKAEKSK